MWFEGPRPTAKACWREENALPLVDLGGSALLFGFLRRTLNLALVSAAASRRMDPVQEGAQKVRIDRWLWAVRLFKTRSLAAEACRGGHVKIADEAVKPSRMVAVGELVQVNKDDILRELRVVGLLEKRVGAKLAQDYVEDLTPPERLERKRESLAQAILRRDAGAGRPTKRERRQIERLFGD